LVTIFPGTNRVQNTTGQLVSFAASNKKLAVDFDAVYTAEDIGAYKPSDRNFDYMLAKLETLGIQKHEILHTAEACSTIMARRTGTTLPPAGYTAAMIRKVSEQPWTRV
jgi:FMN phosphatase YigB (HAD superfamily)